MKIDVTAHGDPADTFLEVPSRGERILGFDRSSRPDFTVAIKCDMTQLLKDVAFMRRQLIKTVVSPLGKRGMRREWRMHDAWRHDACDGIMPKYPLGLNVCRHTLARAVDLARETRRFSS